MGWLRKPLLLLLLSLSFLMGEEKKRPSLFSPLPSYGLKLPPLPGSMVTPSSSKEEREVSQWSSSGKGTITPKEGSVEGRVAWAVSGFSLAGEYRKGYRKEDKDPLSSTGREWSYRMELSLNSGNRYLLKFGYKKGEEEAGANHLFLNPGEFTREGFFAGMDFRITEGLNLNLLVQRETLEARETKGRKSQWLHLQGGALVYFGKELSVAPLIAVSRFINPWTKEEVRMGTLRVRSSYLLDSQGRLSLGVTGGYTLLRRSAKSNFGLFQGEVSLSCRTGHLISGLDTCLFLRRSYLSHISEKAGPEHRTAVGMDILF